MKHPEVLSGVTYGVDEPHRVSLAVVETLIIVVSEDGEHGSGEEELCSVNIVSTWRK